MEGIQVRAPADVGRGGWQHPKVMSAVNAVPPFRIPASISVESDKRILKPHRTAGPPMAQTSGRTRSGHCPFPTAEDSLSRSDGATCCRRDTETRPGSEPCDTRPGGAANVHQGARHSLGKGQCLQQMVPGGWDFHVQRMTLEP